MSLDRQTVSQIQSASDYRYQATLHALAMVAADPATLPSYALLSSGITSISDTGIVNPVSAWGGMGGPEIFRTEALGLTVAHSPQIQWTVSPVADYTQLEAMRCACRWVIEGPEQAGPDCAHILADPEADTSPGSHFGVAERLGRLPQGWLHVGRLCDVPVGACYKDHCGNTWVWVTRDGMEGLAGFTLVLQDIATLNVAPSDGSLPANITPPLLVTLWVVQNALPDHKDSAPASPSNQKEKPKADVYINIVKTPAGKVEYRKEGDQVQRPVQVMFGQSVVWKNEDMIEHTSTSTRNCDSNPLFNTYKIEPNGCYSKVIVFDDAMFAKTCGVTGGSVKLEYESAESKGSIKATIELSAPATDFKSLYSPTLVFRVDRVVRPEFRCKIEQRMLGQIAQSAQQPVPISWDEWMMWTTPYQGQRTSAKPGSSTTKPILPLPTRQVPAEVHLQKLRLVEIKQGVILPRPPTTTKQGETLPCPTPTEPTPLPQN